MGLRGCKEDGQGRNILGVPHATERRAGYGVLLRSPSLSATSASQFSREYTRMYGLPPVRDVARFRTPSARGGSAVDLSGQATA